jgi:hypothetical protein
MDQFSQSDSDPFYSLSPSPPPSSLLPAPEMPAGMPPPPPAPVMLALPPLATYLTKEALFEAIQGWSKDRGYAFTSSRSKVVVGRSTSRQKVYYACDRRFTSRQAERQDIRRSTQSRGTGCLFSVLAIETPSLGWELRYRAEAKFNSHNHTPSQSPAAHPSHRRLSNQAQATAQRLCATGKSLPLVALIKVLY